MLLVDIQINVLMLSVIYLMDYRLVSPTNNIPVWEDILRDQPN
jgi:hypothetical protein